MLTKLKDEVEIRIERVEVMLLSLEPCGTCIGFVEKINLGNKGKKKAFMEAARCIRPNGLKPKKERKKIIISAARHKANLGLRDGVQGIGTPRHFSEMHSFQEGETSLTGAERASTSILGRFEWIHKPL
jgi:hypothetical protein